MLNQAQYTIKDRTFWQIIISLGMASLFVFATMYSLQPILPLFTKDFHIPISYASLSMSLTTVGLIFGLLTIGFLSDRKGRVMFIRLSVISSTIILFIIPFLDVFGLIIFFRFVQGFALAGVAGAPLWCMAGEINPTHFCIFGTSYS